MIKVIRARAYRLPSTAHKRRGEAGDDETGSQGRQEIKRRNLPIETSRQQKTPSSRRLQVAEDSRQQKTPGSKKLQAAGSKAAGSTRNGGSYVLPEGKITQNTRITG